MKTIKCPECNGAGYEKSQYKSCAIPAVRYSCSKCGGTGKVNDEFIEDLLLADFMGII